MSDKLEWRNKHALLLQYRTVQEAVAQGQYKLTPEVEPFVIMDPMPSEDFVTALMAQDRFKEVCEFLAYAMMRRPAAWWGYRALVSLQEELAVKPPVYRDIADIGKPKPFTIPEWAKMPDLEAAKAAAEKSAMPEAESTIKECAELIEGIRAQLPREHVELWDACYNAVDAKFKEKHGLSLMELCRKAGERAGAPPFVINKEKSPIYQEVAALKAKIEAVRQETIAKIKSVIPPVNLQLKKKQADEAMQAVYRWVAAPDEVNSKKAFDVGNAAVDQPEGLLALVAAWSFGDLDPLGKIKIPTPPGMAANGLSSVFLKAALAEGGTRKVPERYEIYAKMGVEIVQGKDLWDESLTEKLPPHATVEPPPPPGGAKPAPEAVYTKWKPTTEESK